MTLHQLKIFEVVANHLNLRAAAEELHIVQPSVSKQLRTLEEEFGAKFHRKVGRNIELTNTGRRFLKDIQTLLRHAEELKRNFANHSSNGSALLSVGGSYSPSATFLPSVLATFTRQHPDVQLSLKTDTKHAVEQMILSDEVDIAAVNNPPQSPDIVMELFRCERLLAFVPANSPGFANGDRLTIAELSHTPLVIRGELDFGLTATEEILREAESKGVQFRIAMRCQSPETVKTAVRENMGVGLLFEGLIRHDVQRGDFKILKLKDLKLVGQSFIIYRRGKPLSWQAEEFLELLRHCRPKTSRR
jgi:DNA-binding transcriptional LysR family regulator